MKAKEELVSANDWLSKAGAFLDGDSVVLPHGFLLIPMTLASESILEFRKAENIAAKIKSGLVVVTMVRIADTAFYTKVASVLNAENPSLPNLCHNCIRGQICKSQMKTFRKAANSHVIHKMESGEVINFNDLGIVEKYYSEIFNLPLMNPIQFSETQNLKLCDRCKRKWRNITGKDSG